MWGSSRRFHALFSFVGGVACLSYVPEFVAKSESLSRSIPRSFLVKSLSDSAAGLDVDLLLCPVRALRIYLDRTLSLAPSRRHLFVSPSCPTRAMSKNAVSFLLCAVIHGAAASRPVVGSVRAHDFRGVSTSVVFTVTGQSPRYLTRPPGAPVRFFHLFTCVPFSMSFRVFAHWVCSWLRVCGSRSPHLFPFCYGGGGGSMSPLSPLLRGSKACVQLLVVVACPSSSCAGLGVSRFHVVFLLLFIVCSLYVHFIYFLFSLCVFYLFVLCVSQPKWSRGVVLLDTCHDE